MAREGFPEPDRDRLQSYDTVGGYDIRHRLRYGDLPHRSGGPDQCHAPCQGVAGECELGEKGRYPDIRSERQRNRDYGRTVFRLPVVWPHRDSGTRPATRRGSGNPWKTRGGDPGKSDSSHGKRGELGCLEYWSWMIMKS